MHFHLPQSVLPLVMSLVLVVAFATISGAGQFFHATAASATPLVDSPLRGVAFSSNSSSRHATRSTDVCTQDVPASIAHCDAHINDIISNIAGAEPGAAFTPKFLQSAYDVAATTKAHGGGAGQIIGIIEAFSNPLLTSDLAVYRSKYRLSSCPVGMVSTTLSTCVIQVANEGGDPAPLPAPSASWGAEAAIDTDMISAICPRCQILIVEAQSSSITDLGAAVNTAVRLGATVVSNSYGSSEYAGEDADSNLYYNHPGIPIVVAAGDNGYGVQFPAASPDVISVGGTALTQKTATGTRNGSESAWAGTASGCSLYEPKPSWQLDTGCANRSVADIAAVADPNTGVWAYDTYQEPGMVIAGGTSIAAQIISAMYALDKSSVPSVRYPAANIYASPNALYHVTTGGNTTCGTYLCNAALSQAGYNGPTGLGSPGVIPNSDAAFFPPAPPTAPTLQSATSANGQVTLQWLSRPQVSGSASMSYVVLESSGGLPQMPVNSTPLTGNIYTVNGLTNGISYVFSVASKNSAGMSLVSNSLSAVPSAVLGQADAPTSVTATAGNTVATIRWSAPLVTGLSPITSYTASNGQGQFCRDQVTVTNANSCVVRGLSNGKSYKFTVVATNQSGSGPASVSSNAVIPVALPGQPLNVLATPGNKGAIVSWSAPLHNGQSPILNYSVSNRQGQSCNRAASVPAINSCIVGGLTDGVDYSFVVRATNAIGTGPESRPSKFVKIEPSTPVAQVSAGAGFVCAKLVVGAVKCWGDNSFGQLGNASFLNSTTPVPVKGVSAAAQISTGTTHACALVTGKVKCWGDNSSNQLGTTKSLEVDTAELVPKLGIVTSLSAGDNYTCAITKTKTVECWGANNYGQLGNGTVTNTSSPRRVVGLSGVVQVSAGADHTCALLANATVQCWGANNYGQLGNATTIDTSTPVTVVALANATQISSGASNSCSLLRNGTVSCWGFNADGELGSATVASSDVAVAVVGITNVQQISSGQYNTCAVLETATVTCWGAQATVLFGNTAPSQSVAPAAIKVLVNVQKIALGSGLSCTLSTQGHVTCWDTTSPNPISLWFQQP